MAEWRGRREVLSETSKGRPGRNTIGGGRTTPRICVRGLALAQWLSELDRVGKVSVVQDVIEKESQRDLNPLRSQLPYLPTIQG